MKRRLYKKLIKFGWFHFQFGAHQFFHHFSGFKTMVYFFYIKAITAHAVVLQSSAGKVRNIYSAKTSIGFAAEIKKVFESCFAGAFAVVCYKVSTKKFDNRIACTLAGAKRHHVFRRAVEFAACQRKIVFGFEE